MLPNLLLSTALRPFTFHVTIFIVGCADDIHVQMPRLVRVEL